MAGLFGCHSPSYDTESLARLFAVVQDSVLTDTPVSSERVGGNLCAAFGGDTHLTPDGIMTAVAGFPRWRAGEFAEIARRDGNAAALAEAYRRKGEGFWPDLAGNFSVAVIDSINRVVLLGLDRIGQHHLFYAPVADGLVFGSNADALIRHPLVSDEIDPQAIFDYVYFHHCPSPGSIYRQVRKLDGAQYLAFRAGRIRVERYWQPEFKAYPDCPPAMLEERLRDSIFGAVARFALPDQQIGAFLSGGLDSSTVAGALAKARAEATHTFSIGFPVEGYDEMPYARIAAGHFRTVQHEYYLTPDDAVAAIPRIAGACDEPFGNSSALPTFFCAKLAKEQGMNLLLGGDGGDELFGGNARYAKQLLFEPYRALPGFVRGGLEAGLRGLPSPIARRFPFSKLVRYVEQAKVPLPDRLEDYNFLHRTEPAEVFSAGLLGEVDPEGPLNAERACYDRIDGAAAVDRMLYLDWKLTLHDNDLVKVNRMCELADMPVAYPMLDDDVVELSCRVAPDSKIRRGELRWFYKKAMAGFLPDAILKKSKHGFGLPFGIWLKEHGPLRDLAYDSLVRLKQRPYFDPEFIDRAIEDHRSGHSSYYGELIWVLMILELWFGAQAGKRSPID